MNAMQYEIYELEVARMISEKVAEGIRSGISPRDVMFIHFAALGASLAMIDENLTASEAIEMAIDGVKRGFLDANLLFGGWEKP